MSEKPENFPGEDMFNHLGEAIKEISSKADLIIFDGVISKKQWDEILESVLVCSCFYTGVFHARPPFLNDFVEKKDVKDKLTKADRKSSGSFFTPVYIAEYIVKSTIGPLVEKIKKESISSNAKIKKICDLKICDPALGGAIFLICAHNFLMEELIAIKSKGLTVSDLSEMALKTLHGVDINPKAIEFSKMVLNLNLARWKTRKTMFEYVTFVDQDSN